MMQEARSSSRRPDVTAEKFHCKALAVIIYNPAADTDRSLLYRQ
jgi:hypothetical protein